MSESNAESQSQEGSPQEPLYQRDPESGRLGWTEGKSQGSTDLGERVDRAPGVGRIFSTEPGWRVFAGGILDQLIQDAREYLAEAIACIDWYENVKEKAERRLDSLESMRLLTSTEDDDDDLPEE